MCISRWLPIKLWGLFALAIILVGISADKRFYCIFAGGFIGPGPFGPVRINRYYWLFVILEGFYGKQKYR